MLFPNSMLVVVWCWWVVLFFLLISKTHSHIYSHSLYSGLWAVVYPSKHTNLFDCCSCNVSGLSALPSLETLSDHSFNRITMSSMAMWVFFFNVGNYGNNKLLDSFCTDSLGVNLASFFSAWQSISRARQSWVEKYKPESLTLTHIIALRSKRGNICMPTQMLCFHHSWSALE